MQLEQNNYSSHSDSNMKKGELINLNEQILRLTDVLDIKATLLGEKESSYDNLRAELIRCKNETSNLEKDSEIANQ